MLTMKVGEKEYCITYGMNTFCDSDVLDRVEDIVKLFSDNNVKSDEDVKALGKIRDLFCVTRELVFIGMQKKNPLETVQDAGNLLDEYRDEAEEGEDRGLIAIFGILANELMSKGFLSDILVANTEKEKPRRLSKKS